MTYSLDFRKKVLEMRELKHLSFKKLSKRFNIGINSIVRWSKNLHAKKNRNKLATKIDKEVLKEDIRKYPDAYMRGLGV